MATEDVAAGVGDNPQTAPMKARMIRIAKQKENIEKDREKRIMYKKYTEISMVPVCTVRKAQSAGTPIALDAGRSGIPPTRS
jgi:hypothetical protein